MNFVVDWFVALQCKTIQYLFMHLLGDLFMGEGNPQNWQTSIPHEQ